MDKVILFSTGCPNCKILKSLLNRKEIIYTENNSIEDMLNLGLNKVPVLCVNDKYYEYQQAKIWIENYSKGESE